MFYLNLYSSFLPTFQLVIGGGPNYDEVTLVGNEVVQTTVAGITSDDEYR